MITNRTVNPPSRFKPEEKRRLIKSASSQEEAIKQFFREHPDEKYHFQDVKSIFNFDKDSVKRSLSNLSNPRPSGPWIDDNGEPPILKLDEKRKNPKSGIRIHLYKWNPKYGRRRMNNQPNLFESRSCAA
ncbi:MAG: hypothetical protein CL670_04815 [Balneola sp.]|jgi:hypothetical protein|nr:hypothetical protein [Balneola sp.]MBE78453.1 hypothetical protein [Balneola sp.]|tara:strand:+ start:656 stop:1045 length:390 start_codon:yes stop_codon:yes gene_type:complete